MSDQTVSCYSSRLLIDYATANGVDVQMAIPYINTPYPDLINNNKWMSAFDWVKLATFVSQSVNKTVEQVGYEIVMSTACNSTFRFMMLRMFPIYLMQKMRLTNKLFSNHINKNQYAVLDNLTGSSVVFRLFIKDKALHAREFCDYNRGAAKALLELRGHIGVLIEDIACVSTEVACDWCVYRMSWTGCNKERGAAKARETGAKLKSAKVGPDLKACILSEKEIAVLFDKVERS